MRERACADVSCQRAKYCGCSGTSSRLLYCLLKKDLSGAFMASSRILRSRDLLQPDDRLAQSLAQRLALRVGQGGLASLANSLRLLGRVGSGRVLDQGIDDGKEVRLAAPVGLAVALDEAGASGQLKRKRDVAFGRVAHQPKPALDQCLLLAVAVGEGPQRPQPGERAHQEVAEDAACLDVHADVVRVELAAPLGPCDEPFPQTPGQDGG